MGDLRDIGQDLINDLALYPFGQEISYTPLGNSEITLNADGFPLEGTFDSAYKRIVEVDGIMIADRAPMLELILAHVTFIPREGDKYTLLEGAHEGETYTVVEAQFSAYETVYLYSVLGDHAV